MDTRRRWGSFRHEEWKCIGTYLHGIFEEEDFAYTFINKYVSQLECHEKVSYKETQDE